MKLAINLKFKELLVLSFMNYTNCKQARLVNFESKIWYNLKAKNQSVNKKSILDYMHWTKTYLNLTRLRPFCPLGKVVNVIYTPG